MAAAIVAATSGLALPDSISLEVPMAVRVGGKELKTAPARGKVEKSPRPATLADATVAPGKGKKKASGAAKRKSRSNKPKRCKGGHPVDIWTGEVIETQEDLFLEGSERLTFRREYSSAWHREKLPFGPGWTHNFHQAITLVDGQPVLRDEDGRSVELEQVEDGESRVYRGLRVQITRKGERFEVLSFEDGKTRIFEPLKKGEPAVLRRIREPCRRSTVLEYEAGRLVWIVSTDKRRIQLNYDARGRIDRVSEVNADNQELAVCRYFYHEFTGELSRVVDATQQEVSFTYDDYHRLAASTLPTGTVFRWVYDKKTGECIETWGGKRLHHWRFKRNRHTREVVATGIQLFRQYQFGVRGELLSESPGDPREIRCYEYDTDLLLTAETDAGGGTTRYEYDDYGALIRKKNKVGQATCYLVQGKQLREFDSEGQGTEKTYDSRGYLQTVRYRDGDERHYDVDECGRIAAIFGRNGLLEERRFNEHGQVCWKRESGGLETEYRHDPRGYVVEKKDSLGRLWKYENDAYGRRLKEIGPDGAVVARKFDAYGHAVEEIDPVGRKTEREYQGTGELAEVRHHGGRTWKYRRDSHERLIRAINPLGLEYHYEPDQQGKVEKELSFDNRNFDYEYDRLGRRIHCVLPDSDSNPHSGAPTSRKHFRHWEYDRHDNIELETSSHGPREYQRDETGKLLRATASEGDLLFTVEYEYDSLGRIVREKQGEYELRYEYDTQSRVVAREVLGERTEYEYNLTNQLVAVTHQGQRTEIQRDIAGREVRRVTGPHPVVIESAWDVCDRLVDRKSYTVAPSKVLTWTLPEELGTAKEKQLSTHRAFHWDRLGRLLQVDDRTWGRTAYTYDISDRLRSASRGRSAEYFVNDHYSLRLTALLRHFDGAEAKPTSYVEASEGLRHPAPAVRRISPEPEESGPGRAIPNAPEAPPLVGVGWDHMQAFKGTHGFDVKRGNQLLAHESQIFEHDAAGRRTLRKHRHTQEITRYTWDCRGQLRQVESPSGWRVRFFYDAFGRRVRKDYEPRPMTAEELQTALEKEFLRQLLAAANGEEPGPPPEGEGPESYSVTYLWDDHELCAELFSDGRKRVHVHERGTLVPLLQSEGGEVFQVVTDHLGTVKDLLDSDGKVAWTAAHGAWGNITECWTAPRGVDRQGVDRPGVGSPFRLLGQMHDPETGLHWTRFRVFESSTARWLSPDPLGLEGGEDHYGFDGAPTVTVDPLGLACEQRKTPGKAPKRKKLPEEETQPGKSKAPLDEMPDDGEASGARAKGPSAPRAPRTADDGVEELLKPFDDRVRHLVELSPTLRGQLKQIHGQGWKVSRGTAGGGSACNTNARRITIDSGHGPARTISALSHEVGHAVHPPDQDLPLKGYTDDEWIEGNIQNHLRSEGYAIFNAHQVAEEIDANGGPRPPIPGKHANEYNHLYHEHQAGMLGHDEAAQQMGNLVGDEVGSRSKKTYQDKWREYYAHQLQELKNRS